MADEKWQKVRETFDSALRRKPEERRKFVHEACGNDKTLLAEVESLLSSLDSATSFMETPAVAKVAGVIEAETKKLETGRCFGHYEIIEQIGAGGMGEVYLARDKKLDRQVAVKILNEKFSQDESNLNRFIHEAKAASALNHPNILTIYEFGETEVAHYIVSEFINGKTLREIFKAKTLKSSEVLDISIQIAGALSAAHSAHIVHRDIKPENVMIRPDGYVKILDFGLAKLVEQKNKSFLGFEELTAKQNQTAKGVILGTVNYMSPEQAKGERVDERTEIFSFGVLIYEMIAGGTPFTGDSMSETFANLINAEPQPLSRFAANVPDEMQRIVSKMLRKKREERYQTMKDVFGDLKDLRENLTLDEKLEKSRSSENGKATAILQATTGGANLQTAEAPIAERTNLNLINQSPLRKYTDFALVAFIVVAFAVSGFIYRATFLQSASPGFRQINLTRLTSFGDAVLAAVSPDGKYIVHVRDEGGKQSLWVRQVNETHDVEIVPSSQVAYQGLTVSPDNRRVFYTAWDVNKSDVALFQVPILGGTPQKVLDKISSAVCFSPDGERIAFFQSSPSVGNSRLIIANTNGSDEKPLAIRKSPATFDTDYGSPAWSPDGKTIVAVGASTTRGVKSSLLVFDAEDGSEKSLTEPRWSEIEQVAWLRDASGLLMIARDESSRPKQIWHIAYPGGEARKITNDLNDYRGLSLTTDSKTIITTQIEQASHLWISASDSIENARPISSEAGMSGAMEGLAWTREGKIIYRFGENGLDDIWQIEKDGSGRKQLTVNAGSNIEPTVCANGNKIVFASKRTGVYRLWRADANGGNPQLLTAGGDDSELYPTCAPEGDWVVYQNGWRKSSVWKVPLAGGESSPVVETFSIRPTLSPDGKLVAYYYLDDDVWGLAIVPVEGGKPLRKFPLPVSVVSRTVRWTPDGKALAYVDTRDGVSNIWLQPLDGNPPRPLTNFNAEHIFYFDWSPGGENFAVARGTITSNVVSIGSIN